MQKILWAQRGASAIKWEEAETPKRWPIHSGQIEVYCFRCGRSWASGHICQKLRLKPLSGASCEAPSMGKEQISPPGLLGKADQK